LAAAAVAEFANRLAPSKNLFSVAGTKNRTSLCAKTSGRTPGGISANAMKQGAEERPDSHLISEEDLAKPKKIMRGCGLNTSFMSISDQVFFRRLEETFTTETKFQRQVILANHGFGITEGAVVLRAHDRTAKQSFSRLDAFLKFLTAKCGTLRLSDNEHVGMGDHEPTLIRNVLLGDRASAARLALLRIRSHTTSDVSFKKTRNRRLTHRQKNKVTTLSGLNGEWTNGDDFDSESPEYVVNHIRISGRSSNPFLVRIHATAAFLDGYQEPVCTECYCERHHGLWVAHLYNTRALGLVSPNPSGFYTQRICVHIDSTIVPVVSVQAREHPVLLALCPECDNPPPAQDVDVDSASDTSDVWARDLEPPHRHPTPPPRPELDLFRDDWFSSQRPVEERAPPRPEKRPRSGETNIPRQSQIASSHGEITEGDDMPQKGRRPNSSTVQKKAPAPAPQPDISGPNTVDTWRGHREKYRDPCRPDDTVASVTLDQIYDETVLPTIQAHLPPINLGPLDCVTHGRNVEEINSLWSDLMIEKLYSHRNLAVSAALIFYLHFNLRRGAYPIEGKVSDPGGLWRLRYRGWPALVDLLCRAGEDRSRKEREAEKAYEREMNSINIFDYFELEHTLYDNAKNRDALKQRFTEFRLRSHPDKTVGLPASERASRAALLSHFTEVYNSIWGDQQKWNEYVTGAKSASRAEPHPTPSTTTYPYDVFDLFGLCIDTPRIEVRTIVRNNLKNFHPDMCFDKPLFLRNMCELVTKRLTVLMSREFSHENHWLEYLDWVKRGAPGSLNHTVEDPRHPNFGETQQAPTPATAPGPQEAHPPNDTRVMVADEQREYEVKMEKVIHNYSPHTVIPAPYCDLSIIECTDLLRRYGKKVDKISLKFDLHYMRFVVFLAECGIEHPNLVTLRDGSFPSKTFRPLALNEAIFFDEKPDLSKLTQTARLPSQILVKLFALNQVTESIAIECDAYETRKKGLFEIAAATVSSFANAMSRLVDLFQRQKDDMENAMIEKTVYSTPIFNRIADAILENTMSWASKPLIQEQMVCRRMVTIQIWDDYKNVESCELAPFLATIQFMRAHEASAQLIVKEEAVERSALLSRIDLASCDNFYHAIQTRTYLSNGEEDVHEYVVIEDCEMVKNDSRPYEQRYDKFVPYLIATLVIFRSYHASHPESVKRDRRNCAKTTARGCQLAVPPFVGFFTGLKGYAATALAAFGLNRLVDAYLPDGRVVVRHAEMRGIPLASLRDALMRGCTDPAALRQVIVTRSAVNPYVCAPSLESLTTFLTTYNTYLKPRQYTQHLHVQDPGACIMATQISSAVVDAAVGLPVSWIAMGAHEELYRRAGYDHTIIMGENLTRGTCLMVYVAKTLLEISLSSGVNRLALFYRLFVYTYLSIHSMETSTAKHISYGKLDLYSAMKTHSAENFITMAVLYAAGQAYQQFPILSVFMRIEDVMVISTSLAQQIAQLVLPGLRLGTNAVGCPLSFVGPLPVIGYRVGAGKSVPGLEEKKLNPPAEDMRIYLGRRLKTLLRRKTDLFDNNREESHVVGKTAPVCLMEGVWPVATPIFPDTKCFTNQISGAISRLCCEMKEPDPRFKATFTDFSLRVFTLLLERYSGRYQRGKYDDDPFSSILTLEAALDKTSYSLADKIKLSKQCRPFPSLGMRVHEGGAKKFGSSGSFGKMEGWDSMKILRIINSYSDASKINLLPWVKTLEARAYALLEKYHVKYHNAEQVAAKAREKLRGRLFATDYTAFECHHKGVCQQALVAIVYFLCPDFPADVLECIRCMMLGMNTSNFKHFDVDILMRLMSGALWTALMNLILNILLSMYLCSLFWTYSCVLPPKIDAIAMADVAVEKYDGLDEGDDGVFQAPAGMEQQHVETAVAFMGVKLKLDICDTDSATFCSMVFAPDGHLVQNPLAMIRKISVIPAPYCHQTLAKQLAYQRAVAVGRLMSGAGHTPILGPFLYHVIKMTRGVRHSPVLVEKLFEHSIGFNRDGGVPPEPVISHAIRCHVERVFGIPVEEQIRLENIIHSSDSFIVQVTNATLGRSHKQLDGEGFYKMKYLATSVHHPPVPPELRTHFQSRVTKKKKSYDPKLDRVFCFMETYCQATSFLQKHGVHTTAMAEVVGSAITADDA